MDFFYEMRITFNSSSGDMTYDYYPKQPLPMIEKIKSGIS